MKEKRKRPVTIAQEEASQLASQLASIEQDYPQATQEWVDEMLAEIENMASCLEQLYEYGDTGGLKPGIKDLLDISIGLISLLAVFTTAFAHATARLFVGGITFLNDGDVQRSINQVDAQNVDTVLLVVVIVLAWVFAYLFLLRERITPEKYQVRRLQRKRRALKKALLGRREKLRQDNLPSDVDWSSRLAIDETQKPFAVDGDLRRPGVQQYSKY